MKDLTFGESFSFENINQSRKENILKSFNSNIYDAPLSNIDQEISKAIETEVLEKGGKRATLGEIREWSGKKYQKTKQGWIPVKGEGDGAESLKDSNVDVTGNKPEKINKEDKESDTDLEHNLKEGQKVKLAGEKAQRIMEISGNLVRLTQDNTSDPEWAHISKLYDPKTGESVLKQQETPKPKEDKKEYKEYVKINTSKLSPEQKKALIYDQSDAQSVSAMRHMIDNNYTISIKDNQFGKKSIEFKNKEGRTSFSGPLSNKVAEAFNLNEGSNKK